MTLVVDMTVASVVGLRVDLAEGMAAVEEVETAVEDSAAGVMVAVGLEAVGLEEEEDSAEDSAEDLGNYQC